LPLVVEQSFRPISVHGKGDDINTWEAKI